MPVAVSVSSSTSRERRGLGSRSNRSVSVGGGSSRKVKSGSKTTTSSITTASSVPPILRTSSPSSPPVKGILVNKDGDQHHHQQSVHEGEEQQQHEDCSNTISSTASSYLKPLLKYLPRHIDPSTIARLLKNVHPSAFGSYRTKEAWRREHPQVLTTAYHMQRETSSDDVDSTSHTAIRPSTSSDETVASSSASCLAHSPPGATFSSSEDDQDGEELGDFNEDYMIHNEHEDDDDDDEFDRREAKELEDYFNDEFDADLGTSPESTSSLRDLTDDDQYRNHDNAWNGSSTRKRTSSQDSNTTSTTAKNGDTVTTAAAQGESSTSSSSTSSSTTLLEAAVASLTSPTSPLAIYLSKPDEEHDSPLAGPSQRVLDAYHSSNNDDASSSADEEGANDSGATIRPSFSAPSHSSLHTNRSHSEQYRQPIASTSAAILYPDFKRRDSVDLRPRTPPSPNSGSSLPPSPSTLSPRYQSRSPNAHTGTRDRSTSSTRLHSSTTDERSRSPQHYPTIPIPRIIKRQTSSSSLASRTSSICTCHSNTSQISNASISSSRSSSIRFAPLPEEEIAQARRESKNRGGNADKSKVMGIKGRRALLLGIRGGGEEDEESPAGVRNASGASPSGSSRPVLDEKEENARSDSDEDDEDDDLSSNGSSFNNQRRSNKNGRKDHFDALAYFGEEDLLSPPPPSAAFNYRGKKMNSVVSPLLDDDGVDGKKAEEKKGNQKKIRQDSDVTIRFGKNGELVERRPLGVTLEELTLPMKRIKETRGRSRQTNDISASFNAPKISSPGLRSPPLSPPHVSSPSSITSQRFSPPMSPASVSRSFSTGAAPSPLTMAALEDSGNLHDASHERTPTPTPRLEKKRFEMFTNITPLSPSSSSSASVFESVSPAQPLHLPLSPTSPHGQSTASTSPSHSMQSSFSSNDITPVPTPRAGSPIAGLKMTTSIFEERGHASSRGFKLLDTFTTSRASVSSSSSPSSPDTSSPTTSNGTGSGDQVEELTVSPVMNLLALGGLLDDRLTDTESSSPGPSVPSLKAGESAPHAKNSDEQGTKDLHRARDPESDNDKHDSDTFENDSADGSESEDMDFDKTPTLHASLDLPKLNDTTHALHARYRKKRSVGIPHGVIAKKKSATTTTSRKSKKIKS